MAENDTTQQGADPSNEREIRFKYVKSNFFRVIHADGAWGGIATRGNIHMSFYNERAALPDSSAIRFDADGKVVAPEEAQTSSSMVREIECDVVFDLVTAIGLRRWLDEKIKELNNIIKEAQEQQATEKSSKVKVS